VAAEGFTADTDESGPCGSKAMSVPAVPSLVPRLSPNPSLGCDSRRLKTFDSFFSKPFYPQPVTKAAHSAVTEHGSTHQY
jgi:hypothetical protein